MLTVFKGGDVPFQLMQSSWTSQLNPLLANPIFQGNQIDSITISSGSAAVVNHLLNRDPQGWFLVDVNAPATIARIAPFNNKTLTLSSDAAVTVSIWVY